jgi:hypothetical protein
MRLLVTIFLVSDVWHLVSMCIYRRLRFQLKHNSNNYNIYHTEITEHAKYFIPLTEDTKEWSEFDSIRTHLYS